MEYVIALRENSPLFALRTHAERKLEALRPFLRLVASAEISPHIRRRVEPSDVVQQTMMEAFTRRQQFAGATERELADWLRRMLQHNIHDAVRGLRRKKRDIARERTLATGPDDSQGVCEADLRISGTTPSQRMIATEELLRMSRAIDQLPEDQREAVILHHLHGMTLAQLAEHFQRHPSAVAGLLHRGLKKLRELLREKHNE